MASFLNMFNPGKNRRIDLSRDLLKSVMVLGAVIEARDAYTGGHTWRVVQYSRLLAEQIGLSVSEIFISGMGGFIHDIGKVGIPDQVLNKTGELTEDEFSLLKTHPVVGKKLLDDHPLGPLVLDSITYHHERCDGQGETISTAFVKAAVDQVVSKLMVKRHQMRWSPQAAHF